MRLWQRKHLTWRGTRLFAGNRKNPVAEVVSDHRWPGMWRFRLLPDGELSDMVNLSRAKDAASAVTVAVLNKVVRASVEPSSIEPTPSPLPEAPSSA